MYPIKYAGLSINFIIVFGHQYLGGIYIKKSIKAIVVGTLSLGLLLTATGTSFAYEYDYEQAEIRGHKYRDAIQAKTKKMTVKQKTNYYNNFMNALVKQAKKEKTDAGKLRILYDGIASQITFDKETENKRKVNKESYTAKGAIVNGTAVKRGYALALADALTRLGYTNIIANTSKDAEVWNKVKIGKSWFNMDVSWGDSDYNDMPWYTFFLRSDIMSENVHEGYKSPSKYKATSEKYDPIGSIGMDNLLFRDSTGFYFMYGNDGGIYRYDYNMKKKTYQKFKRPAFELNVGNGYLFYQELLGEEPEDITIKNPKNVVMTPLNNLSKKRILMKSDYSVEVELIGNKIKVTEIIFIKDHESRPTYKEYFFNY